ncbi:uncharacterized protein LOC135501812 isoform X2 [Lineus longissimus]|uniref:uncharacterized protein LOC135501812 isoform X2 n=1 Tax=Lineus longissimus TaxID=88925 RepID=UPI002B4F576F
MVVDSRIVMSPPLNDCKDDLNNLHSGKDVSPRSGSGSSGCDGKPVYRKAKGQLKLSIYMNCGLLTVHIIQARRLKSKWKALGDAYVKISLVPDTDRRSRCKTAVIPDTNNPLFDQKFSFELLEEDHRKRLLVSIWHRDETNNRSEFLGCMSFGVKHLLEPTRPVNGWYYLLTEDTGRRKHLQAPSEKSPALKERCHKNIPEVNKDVLWMDPLNITIKRRKTGYGFTLVGCSPAAIGRIDAGSAAEEAGLQSGDCIVRINGQNVSRSSADSVGRIIRHCRQKVILDIQRAKRLDVPVMESLESSPSIQHAGDSKRPSRSVENDHLADSSDDSKENQTRQRLESRGVNTVTPSLTFNYQDLPDIETFRQEATQRLLKCEELYIKSMRDGISRYLKPLKRQILSTTEHSTVFQNIEKLVTISEYYVRQLKLNSLPYIDMDKQRDGFIDAGGYIYMSKLQLVCEAYTTYCSRLQQAKIKLAKQMKDEDFRTFIENAMSNDTSNFLTLEEFLIKPQQHVWQMLIHLQSVQMYTSTQHHDFSFIEEVVQELRKCCTAISYSSPSSGQGSPSYISTSTSRSTTTSSLVSSSSCDSEIVDLQNRVSFSEDVKTIPLVIPNRHFIYSSGLKQMQLKGQRKIFMLLFTDILLIAEQDTPNNFIIVEEPVYLTDIVFQDFSRPNVNEFQVIWKVNDSYQSMVLKVPCIEQKHTWKALLQQRLETIRSMSADLREARQRAAYAGQSLPLSEETTSEQYE